MTVVYRIFVFNVTMRCLDVVTPAVAALPPASRRYLAWRSTGVTWPLWLRSASEGRTPPVSEKQHSAVDQILRITSRYLFAHLDCDIRHMSV